MRQKRVLEGTRDDFVEHITVKLRDEMALAANAKQLKQREAHAAAAGALEWVIAELEAWVETPAEDDGDDDDRPQSGPASTDGHATEAVRREAAANSL